MRSTIKRRRRIDVCLFVCFFFEPSGAEHVYVAGRNGVEEKVEPKLGKWKVQNFTEEEVDKWIEQEEERRDKTLETALKKKKEEPELS